MPAKKSLSVNLSSDHNPMPDPEVTSPAVLSIEESIQRLKAEILSVDWRITEKRAEQLEASFNCLRKRFKNRKTVFAIIVMASNVLAYIRKKGEAKVPATVDFIKEAMAHIVTFYEDPRLDPENDKKIFKSIYHHFTLLKKKIHNEQQRDKEEAGLAGNDEGPEKILKEAACQSLELQKQNSSAPPSSAGGPQPSTLKSNSPADPPREMDRQRVAALLRELKDSLQKAEELGSTIRYLLGELAAKHQIVLPAMESSFLQGVSPAGTDDASEGEAEPSGTAPATPPEVDPQEPAALPRESRQTPCARTELLIILLGEKQIAIESGFVTARRAIQEARRAVYLKSSTVPLKDFGRFLQGLANQFNGCLAGLKNNKLRNLSLPILTPRGINLPDKPMENGQEMLVLCNHNWCGILLCTAAEPGQAAMIANRQCNDGDLWKMACTEDGRELPLLNCVALLQREGNMILV